MVENYSGTRSAYVLVGRESTWGIPVSCTKDLGIVTDINPQDINEAVKSRGLSSRDLDYLQMGKFNFQIDVTTEWQHGRLAEYAFGGIGHSGSSDPYTHTISGADTVPPFTLENGVDGTADIVMKYGGCKVNTYTLAMDLRGVLTQRATIFAQKPVKSTSASSAVTSTLPTLPWAIGAFKVGAAGSEAAVAQCRSFEFGLDNHLDKVEKWGSYVDDNHSENERDYSCKATLGFTDANELGRFLDGTTSGTGVATTDYTKFSVVIDLVNAGATREMKLTLSNAMYSANSRPMTVGNTILQEVTLDFSTAVIVSKDSISDTAWS